MRTITLIALLLAAPLAYAQSAAPMLVVGGETRASTAPAAAAKPASEVEQERILEAFPEWAITRAGAATGGTDADTPTAPDSPPPPAAAPAAPAPAPAPNVAAPQAPPSPISKLWPIDTIPIFMQSCVGSRLLMAGPCHCVISNLMPAMGHDEFLRKTADGTIEDDKRLIDIRARCLTQANETLRRAEERKR